MNTAHHRGETLMDFGSVFQTVPPTTRADKLVRLAAI